MSSKIYKTLSDMFSINAEYDAKLVEVNKIIDSCRTSIELENCKNLLESIENQLKNSIERFSNENRFVNFITRNVFTSFLTEKMYCKMYKTNEYYRKKFVFFDMFEQGIKKTKE
jgi:hypothetical protein